MRHLLAVLVLAWTVSNSDGTPYPPTGAYWPIQVTVYFRMVNGWDAENDTPTYTAPFPARYFLWSRTYCGGTANACIPGDPGPGDVWMWEDPPFPENVGAHRDLHMETGRTTTAPWAYLRGASGAVKP